LNLRRITLWKEEHCRKHLGYKGKEIRLASLPYLSGVWLPALPNTLALRVPQRRTRPLSCTKEWLYSHLILKNKNIKMFEPTPWGWLLYYVSRTTLIPIIRCDILEYVHRVHLIKPVNPLERSLKIRGWYIILIQK